MKRRESSTTRPSRPSPLVSTNDYVLARQRALAATYRTPSTTAKEPLQRDDPVEINEALEATSEEDKINTNSSDSSKRKDVPSELLQRLATFPLFKNAPQAFHRALASKFQLMPVHAQEYIVKFGEPAKAMYWILRGSVAVTSPDGEAVHAELVAGDFFGEIGILFNRPRTATVVAKTKVLLCVLTSDSLNALLPEFPAVERRIRDEAQERLAMLDKRKRIGITKISGITNINNNNLNKNNSIDRDSLVHESFGAAAATVTAATASIPGPSVPPQYSNQSLYVPCIHDNVDYSVPTRDFLRGLPMFTLLPSNIIHELVLGVEPRRVEAFEYIVRKGELGRDIYFIVNGEVEALDSQMVFPYEEQKEEQKVDRVLARLGPGQYFGEMAFLKSLSDHKLERVERSADIRSVSTVDLLIVTGHQLENLYSRYPRICDEMRDTAAKRSNKNKSLTVQDKDPSLQDTPFSRWKGFQASASSSVGLRRPKLASHSIDDNDPRLSLKYDSRNSSSDFSSVQSSENRLSTGVPSSSVSSSITNSSPKLDLRRKRSRSLVAFDNFVKPSSLTLDLPPLNPVLPSVNNYPKPKMQQQIPLQYMNHAKRLRLSSIGGRRRSSVLSTGPLPDRLLLRSFSYLSLPELMKLRIICRRWRQLLYVAPSFFEVLDLTKWNTSIDDKSLIQITDFVGSRPKVINLSNCFHVTDVGFCYMVNEIGMMGTIEVMKLKSVWEVNAMAIMDLSVPSVGGSITELDLSNCRKVRDDVIERLIGWGTNAIHQNNNSSHLQHYSQSVDSLDPIKEMDSFDNSNSFESSIGCVNLKRLSLGYCKHITDRTMYHIAHHANSRLEMLDITRCTTITDSGFAFWAYHVFTNLKELKMSDCTFLSDKSISAVASSAPYLEKLDLSFCCALKDISIEYLCIGCPYLKHLDFSFCGSAVSDSTLLTMSLNFRNLMTLRIRGCVRVTRAGVDAILSNCVSLKYLDISQCKNSHYYKGNIPAPPIIPNKNSKSAFVTTSYGGVVEIVI